MVDRHPLIVNPTASQIQELPSGDYLYGTIPVGGIIMWSGTIATIPSNWSLCNGSNGTPDLRNKFIVGANADSGGSAKTNVTGSATQSGGSTTASDTVTISDSDTVTLNASPSTLNGQITLGSNGTGAISTAGAKSLTVNVTASDTVNISGSDTVSVSTLSPYFALAYIMRTT